MVKIQSVWVDNLEEEMAEIRKVMETHPYVAMDTEFPGIVARPIGTFKSNSEYQFQTLRCNVDLLKIIQLGLTFSDIDGNLHPNISTWQFNFKFNLSDDMFAQDSIEMLQNSGIDFQKHAKHGIEIEKFGELLISSGLVLVDDVKWISFHGTYDFGYLLKVLTCEALPKEESEFQKLLHQFFPCLYDIKFIMKGCKILRGGLQEVADNLDIQRIGIQHQAGSDSLLTSSTFFKLRKTFFEDEFDDRKYLGHLYGLGAPYHSRVSNPNQTESLIEPQFSGKNLSNNTNGTHSATLSGNRTFETSDE
jgi:CCR4-NOT transcription complex subunit 7/8